MKILDAAAIYYVIAKSSSSANKGDAKTPIVKVAFDTRRIDQENDYNPRRGLQYYHRSEGFITKNTAAVVNTFTKLKEAADQIKEKYIGSPEWLDSYCRVLCASLDRILRADQKDTEYFDPQLDYLEELVDLRYRLKLADIDTYDVGKLKEVILSKDEELSNAAIYNMSGNKEEQTIHINGIEDFIKDLLRSAKANSDNKSIERSITITVKDKIVE